MLCLLTRFWETYEYEILWDQRGKNEQRWASSSSRYGCYCWTTLKSTYQKWCWSIKVKFARDPYSRRSVCIHCDVLTLCYVLLYFKRTTFCISFGSFSFSFCCNTCLQNVYYFARVALCFARACVFPCFMCGWDGERVTFMVCDCCFRNVHRRQRSRGSARNATANS